MIGEASGAHENEDSLPFRPHAPAGSILEKAIRTAGYTREDFWITNIIRCRPPNNYLSGAPYERESINHCSQYLNRAIAELKPRAILALGSIPLRELTGRLGDRASISYLRGFVLSGPNGIPVVPTFHPSFITRKHTALIGTLIKDINTARSAAAGRITYTINPKEEIECREGVKAFEDFLAEVEAESDAWIAYDIETPYSQKGDEDELVERTTDGECAGEDEEDGGDMVSGRYDELPSDESRVIDSSGQPFSEDLGIISIQFAISDTWGIYGDWRDPKIRELAQKILATPNPKIAHNGDHFDQPRLEQEGIRINGEKYDSLSMRKALQPDLPAKLQQVAVDYGWSFPWKHFSGTDAEFYGICDVCSLIRIASKLPNEMDKLGMWDGYQRYIREQREKSEIPWERRGIPINKERLDDLREWLEVEVTAKVKEIISIVPPELHKMDPPKGFSNLPGEIKPFVYEKHPTLFDPIPQVDKDGNPKLDKEGNIKYKKSNLKVTQVYDMLLGKELNGTLDDVLSNFPDIRVTQDGKRLFRFVPFNPRSSKQMIEYLKFMKMEVPKTFREGKETTADKVMRRLEEKTKDPVIKLSREIRALEKMRDSYAGKRGEDGVIKGGWIPDADGRLRTGAHTNSTLQYSSKAPNVFTLPKRRKELADRFRRCVAAEPGHVIIEADFKAFHDLTTAVLANDERKWRTAKIDPHSYVAGWLVKYPGIEKALDMSDSDLKLYLEEIKKKHKKIRDEQAKPLNHGFNFGESPNRLYYENEEFFDSLEQAKQMHKMLGRIYPATVAWQENLLKSLDIGGGRVPYLQNAWGFRRWLWDCWTWRRAEDGRWYKTKGQDSEKALAYLPASNAHGLFRKKMREAAEWGWLEKYELILFPHDAWILHPPKELADECIENIKRHLESPVMELANPMLCPSGFSCSVDVSIGDSMAEMEEIKF
jgi:uracil-DNA glycosylase family 4